ncbi:MAG: pyridoxamine 5'-phosphate oxidase family protein [Cytophagales bacterium]|nr:pyridoxamine 5'-phosphate oxidase family protein [Cytophagales bacterium]
MLGSLNKSQVDNLLRAEVVGRIGCHADGKTYVVPITFAYDGEYIYCHTIDGMKINMMRDNPDVCFEVDRVENLANWQSVVAWGKYEELGTREAEEALQILSNRVHPLTVGETSRPKHGLDRAHEAVTPKMKMVVFRIKVKEATGRFEKFA